MSRRQSPGLGSDGADRATNARANREFHHLLRAANFTVHLEHPRARANNKGPRHTIYLAQKSPS